MPELFDTHAHLDFKAFDRDRDEVIARARADGVRYLTTIGSGDGVDSLEAALAIAEAHDDIWATVGVHPHDAKIMNDEILSEMRALTARPKIVAVGEIGLDWARMLSPREVQIQWFRAQLALARETDLPVIIHDRDAHDDLVKVLKQDGVGRAGGIIHCFSGTLDLARELLPLGFYISFSGTVTYPGGGKLREAARAIPADRVLVETDCPFLSPHPHPRKGHRNEPALVRLTAEVIAQVRGIALDDFAAQSTRNALEVYRLGWQEHA
jgi:TatD DNase family protein